MHVAMVGLNAEAIRDVAQRLAQQGEDVSGILRGVDSLLRLAEQNWRGDDLRQFSQLWQQQHKPTCLRLAEQLGDLAQVADRNVQAQVDASGTLGDAVPASATARAGDSAAGAAMKPSFVPGDMRSLYEGVLEAADYFNGLQRLGGLNSPYAWNANLEGVKTGSPLLSTLLYLPEALDAFTDATAGMLDAAGLIEFTGRTFDLGSTFLEAFGKSYAGDALGNSLGAVGGALQAVTDWGGAAEAFQDGNVAQGVYDVVHGGVAAVGGVVPQVKLGLAAWDLGVGIGTAIGTSPPAEAFQDRVVAFGGTQGGDIGTRYDGVGGVGNYLHDNAAVAVSDAANAVSGAVNFVGSLFR